MAGTLVANTINTDTGLFSTNNAYSGIANAWVNFNGNSGASPVIRQSFNVSSVTRNGTGDYTVTFANAFVDINYTALVSGNYNLTGGNNISFVAPFNQAPTTTTIRIQTTACATGTVLDQTYVTLVAFR